jgi:hypothetical protein
MVRLLPERTHPQRRTVAERSARYREFRGNLENGSGQRGMENIDSFPGYSQFLIAGDRPPWVEPAPEARECRYLGVFLIEVGPAIEVHRGCPGSGRRGAGGFDRVPTAVAASRRSVPVQEESREQEQKDTSRPSKSQRDRHEGSMPEGFAASNPHQRIMGIPEVPCSEAS